MDTFPICNQQKYRFSFYQTILWNYAVIEPCYRSSVSKCQYLDHSITVFRWRYLSSFHLINFILFPLILTSINIRTNLPPFNPRHFLHHSPRLSPPLPPPTTYPMTLPFPHLTIHAYFHAIHFDPHPIPRITLLLWHRSTVLHSMPWTLFTRCR